MRSSLLPVHPSPQPSPSPLTWPSWWISMISGESWCYCVPCACTNEPLPHSHLLRRRPVIGRCKVTLGFTPFIFKRDGLFFPPASGTEDLSLLLDGLGENTKIGEHLYILFDLPPDCPRLDHAHCWCPAGPWVTSCTPGWVLLRFSSCSVLISCVIFAITSSIAASSFSQRLIIRSCHRRVARGVGQNR